MGLFSRRSKLTDNGRFSGDDPFHVDYEARPVPIWDNPLRYAYDSLGLPGTAPVGRATSIRGLMPGWLPGQQLMFYQQQLVSGMPPTAGSVYQQPLYDPGAPNDGYVWAPNSGVLDTHNNVV